MTYVLANAPSATVSVEYLNEMQIPEIFEEVEKCSSPHIFLWYIGTYGLKKRGVWYYRDAIINPLLQSPIDSPTIWLVDLTAWGAFRDSNIPITKKSSFCETIQRHPSGKIRSIDTATIFKEMQELKSRPLIDYMAPALRREFINKPSENFTPCGTSLGQIFNNKAELLTEFFKIDTCKCYSNIQYLEAFFLIEKAIEKSLQENNETVNVVFILQNDELKYYYNKMNDFQEDLKFFINSTNKRSLDVNVKFISFKYGNENHHRPYNSPGAVFGKNELKWDDIAAVNFKNFEGKYAYN